MPVATASKEAYGRMRSVPPKEHPVYKFLKTFGTETAGYSNRQIAAIMGRPINTITPRIFELRQAGVVVLAGKRKDLYSGIEVSHWRIATEAEEASFKRMTTVPPLPAPRVWERLSDVPAGITVEETAGDWIGSYWERDARGYVRMQSEQNRAWGSWSSFQLMSRYEAELGPVTEVIA